MTTSPDPVVVVGAGVGGLAVAARVAARGRRVIVVEQGDAVGGKLAEHRADGFRWDTGPSVLTLRPVLEETFRAAGTRLDDHVDLIPLDPTFRCRLPDGTCLDVPRDPADLLDAVARVAPEDVDGLRAFLQHVARIHDATAPVFLHDHPPTWRSLLRSHPLDLVRADPLRTMQGAIDRHVRSGVLRALLGQFAMYVGASPLLAPATLNVIAHVQLSGGVWFPRGGMYRLAVALRAAAEAQGVEVHTGTPVARIEVVDGAARGVVLQDGRTVRASSVVSNVDVATTYGRLLPDLPALRRRRTRLHGRRPSASYVVTLLGVRGDVPELLHHTYLFAADPLREFREVFETGEVPSDPTLYVAHTGLHAPGDAPPGTSNLFVLAQVPALDEASDAPWEEGGVGMAERLVDLLAVRGLDLRQRILSRHVLTPVTFRDRTGAWRGAIYGGDTNARMSVFRRPGHKDPHIRDLFHVGGTTHPGGGVPLAMLSARCVAAHLLGEGGGVLGDPALASLP